MAQELRGYHGEDVRLLLENRCESMLLTVSSVRRKGIMYSQDVSDLNGTILNVPVCYMILKKTAQTKSNSEGRDSFGCALAWKLLFKAANRAVTAMLMIRQPRSVIHAMTTRSPHDVI